MRNGHFLSSSRLLLSLMITLGTAAVAMGQTGILTPADWGDVTSYYFSRAFDDQPTWSGSQPVGGDTSYNAFLLGWESAYVSYIDLGTDWADWRIEQTWTKYMNNRSGVAHPYAEVWWDDDTDTTNDGVTETTLNFCTQDHDSSGSWMLDADVSANPITPQGRYLMLRQPAYIPNKDVIEAAFVGYIQSNYPPTVDAGNDQIARISDGATLDATTSDDGQPDPPAALTFAWTKQSGPGTVTFDDDEAEDTSADFSATGEYVLRLTVDDGELEEYDELTVTVMPDSEILTPTDWGNVSSYRFQYAFNAQPTWNGSALVGGDSGYDGFWASWEDSGSVSYIDLGEDWPDWRIEQVWTKYMNLRAGDAHPYAMLWWDDDTDEVNDGPPEFTLNFCTQAHDSSGPWLRDVDATADPILPRGRYLMLKQPVDQPATADVTEIAWVGYVCPAGSNRAPVVAAGPDQSTLFPNDTVDLDGTVTDDGLPNPPAGVTTTWTKQSGPGTVTFGNANAVDTTATFSQAGTYVLRLTADDSALDSWDEMTVNVCPALPSVSMQAPAVFDFQSLTLVDEVDCGDANDPHTLYESAQGDSEIQTILNDQCRVIPNVGEEPKFFAYKIGVNCNLEAGKGYVLVVEYPEDLSRNTIVRNYGCETNRGFYTGLAVGDCHTPPYVSSNAESCAYGLSHEYRQWQQLFYLNDRTRDTLTGIARLDDPEDDGFYVAIAQFKQSDCPVSNGAAVRRIALYEAPSPQACVQQLAELPAGLPKRHLFWREEMSDGVVKDDPSTWGIIDPIDYYRYKARLYNFLGMNTFCKDLLEFGHCQDWDCGKYANWYVTSRQPYRWEQILAMLANEDYNLDVMPYYEYTGSTSTGVLGLGPLKRSEPLSGSGNYYTQITWTEKFNIDVSDPDAVTDSQRLLEVTIKDLAEGNRPVPVDFAGERVPGYSAGLWGYIDFGPDWQDIRITEGWTRSRMYNSDPPSPYQAVYWHSTTAGFSGSTVPQGAIAETTVNFITQSQSGVSYYWTRDFHLLQANAITPQARYLCLRGADTMSDCVEFALVGWIEDGGDPQIQTLVPYGAGSITGNPMDRAFDNQPEYNTKGLNFVGAWLRTRPSSIPNGFSDTTLERFRQDIGYPNPITRSSIEGQGLMEDYYDWWNLERRGFVLALRDYLQTNVNADAAVLYTWDHNESGTKHPTDAPLTICDSDYLTIWESIGSAMTYDDSVANDLHLEAMQLPLSTWGGYEWHHSVPPSDPWNYTNDDGAMMTYTFNKPYTVGDSDWLEQYECADGMAAVHHFCLNEDTMTDSQDNEIIGYFVCDFEPAGPYSMLCNARAVAYGNPRYIGYLSSNNFNRGFPAYAREFNANFLALPALPMTTETGATTETDVVVRSISTVSDGIWLAIVNAGMEDKDDVEITLPVSGTTTDAVTGQSITVSNGKITLDLWPGQLKSIHIDD